jgi:hypothetical protein
MVGSLGGDVLRSPVVMDVDGVIAELQPGSLRQRLSRLRAELSDIDQALSRLADAIAAGGPLEALVSAITARQTRRDELVPAIAAAERAERHAFNRNAIAEKVRQMLADWRGLITSDVQGGRRLLRETLVGPLRFTAEGRSYRFEGEVGDRPRARWRDRVTNLCGVPKHSELEPDQRVPRIHASAARFRRLRGLNALIAAANACSNHSLC